MLDFGGADGPGVESIRSAVTVVEVASSSSSKTLATTVAAEDEYSESSMEVCDANLHFEEAWSQT